MKKNINKLLNIFLCIIFFILFFGGPKSPFTSVEDLDIYIGAGYSMKDITKKSFEYIIGTTSNIYKGDVEPESEYKVGRSLTLGETREDRQRKIGKEFFLGLTRLYLLDEEYARESIKSTLDILFKNSIINDNGAFVVCKGKNENYYKFNEESYENNAQYIYDMIKNSSFFNFYGENYTLKNAIISMDSEGKNIVSPYIILKENGITLNGTAIFKKDKLAFILDLEDSRTMNMLRENKSKGVISILGNNGNVVNYDTTVKRKVKCEKIGDKYYFTIYLKLNGDVINNTLYKGMTGKTSVIKTFEKDMKKQIEENCNKFINKMQNQYKIDCLQLGWIAAGKYGRDTGVEWNEVISKSDIKVNVQVKVDKLGRGEFRVED